MEEFIELDLVPITAPDIESKTWKPAKREEIWQRFTSWCKEQGPSYERQLKGARTFFSEFSAIVGEQGYRRTKDGFRVFYRERQQSDPEAGSENVLWLAALTLGARKSELLGLQWADFEGCQVHIHQQLVRYRLEDRKWGPWTRGPLKTDKEDGHAKGVRWIEVPPVLAKALEEHKTKAKPECPWVFATAAGTPLEPRNVTTYFDRAQAQAGVPQITFHGMRHSHASLLLEHGADPLAVADRLGHSLQVLLKTYRHILDKRKDRAAGVARSLFGVPNGQ